MIPLSHATTHPDLSYPYQTTDVLRFGLTNEYREVSKTGVVPAVGALYRAPSRSAREPPADLEKARHLKDMNLVVFKVNDPEDPRTWKNWYRWCTFRSYVVRLETYLFATRYYRTGG